MQKTVTSLFKDLATAQKAYDHLLAEGFDRSDVSLMVNLVKRKSDPFKRSKARYWRRGEVDAPMGVLIGLLVGAAVGVVVGALIAVFPMTYSLGVLVGWGAAIGGATGAASGGILNSSMPRMLGQNLNTVEKAGATLVRVRADDDRLDKAREILRDHDPVDMEGRLETWDEKGWEAYDPAADAVR